MKPYIMLRLCDCGTPVIGKGKQCSVCIRVDAEHKAANQLRLRAKLAAMRRWTKAAKGA